MPFTDILILSGIVAAFTAFGVTLAWGEYQTRHLVRPEEPRAAGEQEKHQLKRAA